MPSSPNTSHLQVVGPPPHCDWLGKEVKSWIIASFEFFSIFTSSWYLQKVEILWSTGGKTKSSSVSWCSKVPKMAECAGISQKKSHSSLVINSISQKAGEEKCSKEHKIEHKSLNPFLSFSPSGVQYYILDRSLWWPAVIDLYYQILIQRIKSYLGL